jgi:hypothetical protein
MFARKHKQAASSRPPIVADQAGDAAWDAATAVTPPIQSIDMKILVLASDGNEAVLPAIKEALQYLGTPYTVHIATQRPYGLIPGRLSSGSHGYYQGVILTNSNLAYHNGGGYVSALSLQEWADLQSYEASFGVREVIWYTYPGADYGYQEPGPAVDTTTSPISMRLTSRGKDVFTYLNPKTTIPIQHAHTYLARPLDDASVTPLLTDQHGNALAAIRTHPDGREVLSLTFDGNPDLIHTIVLGYGLINWVTEGVFLGERHIYMSAQVDDLFIEDSNWLPATPCGTDVDETGAFYRISEEDLQAVIHWQNARRSEAVSAQTTLTMAFNGCGAAVGEDEDSDPDSLTRAALDGQAMFYWVNHTYGHANLDDVDYATANAEIQQNTALVWETLRLTNYSLASMVTPDVSGLNNPDFLQAAYDDGVRYLVSDTSVSGFDNTSPNAGIYSPYRPEILMIPRRPNNLYYNVSTPQGWVAEYNCMYQSHWGRALSYAQILDVERQMLLAYLLKGDIDPWMFHQPNLRAYDGTHTLLGDLLDQALQKYSQYYTLAILNKPMDALGRTVASRMRYNEAGVRASIVAGVSITLVAQEAATVPVTGLASPGCEVYGGQDISYITLSAGQSLTLPLAGQAGAARQE